jgi:hypothetical protein
MAVQPINAKDVDFLLTERCVQLDLQYEYLKRKDSYDTMF